jgi:hypothetical protein
MARAFSQAMAKMAEIHEVFSAMPRQANGVEDCVSVALALSLLAGARQFV